MYIIYIIIKQCDLIKIFNLSEHLSHRALKQYIFNEHLRLQQNTHHILHEKRKADYKN